ncbi:unnamed protein product [Soboliphyme baturini]|uniref:Transmembrane protein n=1 Tax=Soboliphyme baturini TaxID=241478 RepID=A0A183JA78_9BILA|nr:unnamed protein product [Soboliphyme baturini]
MCSMRCVDQAMRACAACAVGQKNELSSSTAASELRTPVRSKQPHQAAMCEAAKPFLSTHRSKKYQWRPFIIAVFYLSIAQHPASSWPHRRSQQATVFVWEHLFPAELNCPPPPVWHVNVPTRPTDAKAVPERGRGEQPAPRARHCPEDGEDRRATQSASFQEEAFGMRGMRRPTTEEKTGPTDRTGLTGPDWLKSAENEPMPLFATLIRFIDPSINERG